MTADEFMKYLPLYVENLSKQYKPEELKSLHYDLDRQCYYPLPIKITNDNGELIFELPPRANYIHTVNEHAGHDFGNVNGVVDSYMGAAVMEGGARDIREQRICINTVNLGKLLCDINLERNHLTNMSSEVARIMKDNYEKGVLPPPNDENKETAIDEETSETSPISEPVTQRKWDTKNLEDIPL